MTETTDKHHITVTSEREPVESDHNRHRLLTTLLPVSESENVTTQLSGNVTKRLLPFPAILECDHQSTPIPMY